MDTDIFEQFPDRETFDKYWNENYQPVTYEDVREAFTDFVKSADGHIYLSDYEEKGMISREDFKENLSQEAQFTFEDGLTEVFYDKNPELYETAFALYEESKLTGKGDASSVCSKCMAHAGSQTIPHVPAISPAVGAA